MLKQEDLIKKVKTYNPFLDHEALNKAYKFALRAHKNQKRESGDPYLIHPVAVADILSDLKLDSATIATGLLHDTIEDTYATYDTIKEEIKICNRRLLWAKIISKGILDEKIIIRIGKINVANLVANQSCQFSLEL